MFDRGAVLAVLLAAGVVGSDPSALGAQSREAALRRRVDSLTVLVDTAFARARAKKEADPARARRAQEIDSTSVVVRVGSMTIRADSVLAQVARATLEEAWPAIARTFGSHADKLSGHVFELRESVDTVVDAGQRTRMTRDIMVRSFPNAGRDSSETARRGSGPRRVDSDALAATWRHLASSALNYPGDPLEQWTRHPLVTDNELRERLAYAYRSLATNPRPEASSCFDGDIGACRTVLGFQGTGSSDGYDANTSLRLSFALVAIAAGGPEAYPRFLAPPERPLVTRFEDAARLPIDSLVGRWHAQLFDARPQPTRIPVPTALMAVVWAGICCGLSLRSTRWR